MCLGSSFGFGGNFSQVSSFQRHFQYTDQRELKIFSPSTSDTLYYLYIIKNANKTWMHVLPHFYMICKCQIKIKPNLCSFWNTTLYIHRIYSMGCLWGNLKKCSGGLCLFGIDQNCLFNGQKSVLMKNVLPEIQKP